MKMLRLSGRFVWILVALLTISACTDAGKERRRLFNAFPIIGWTETRVIKLKVLQAKEITLNRVELLSEEQPEAVMTGPTRFSFIRNFASREGLSIDIVSISDQAEAEEWKVAYINFSLPPSGSPAGNFELINGVILGSSTYEEVIQQIGSPNKVGNQYSKELTLIYTLKAKDYPRIYLKFNEGGVLEGATFLGEIF